MNYVHYNKSSNPLAANRPLLPPPLNDSVNNERKTLGFLRTKAFSLLSYIFFVCRSELVFVSPVFTKDLKKSL